ncbi:MAG: hypothetical protein CVV39_06085 [Planctomycetes bacterium HGW-Planctomycetes-1]|nr:MAG: hypothetical protein CVV39_06085 [Planctomycetes bacterium HGW-Planctomycetes-1]
MKFLKKIFAPKEVKAALGVLDELNYECNSHAFPLVREQVELAILEQPEKFVSVLKSQSRTPREKVYSMIENVAGDYLESGSFDFFIYRGFLNPCGKELLKVYNHIIDRMEKDGCISKEEAQKQKSNIQDRIKEVG